MQLFLRLFVESFKVATTSLMANRLRTFLSLLGIVIGITTIIGVYAAVDSLESQIRKDIKSLGDNVIYVQKWPWAGGSDFPWWKYWQRPEPDYDDYLAIKDKIESASAVGFVFGVSKTVKYQNNSVENVSYFAVTPGYLDIWSIDIAEGRFFTDSEFANGKPFVVLGHEIAEGLFPSGSALGKEVKNHG